MRDITVRNPLDMHLHLRDDDMLSLVAPLSAGTFSGGLVMPNLVPPITNLQILDRYKSTIADSIGENSFKPYMTIFYRNYDREFIKNIKDSITAMKLYPAGITTNSDSGISSFDIDTMRPTLETMSELNIPLCVHGETDGFVMDREAEFMDIYESLATAFPRLKIIMEHITTKAATKIVQKHDNLFATVTAHHLLLTLDDVAGGLLKPHLFCKPIAKRHEDKDALVDMATSGHYKIMFGSDSAPHPTSSKECCGCAAGVFTAPIAIQLMAELFLKDDKNIDQSEQNLQKFMSDNAIEIYGISPPPKSITLENKEFIVPKIYKNKQNEVTPMKSGEILKWRIK